MFATVCGIEWNVSAAALPPPQNGAIVRTDSVSTKSHLQNFKTCMRNLHSSICLTKNAREVSSPGKGDLGFIIHTKLMLVHSASRFMQLKKKPDS